MNEERLVMVDSSSRHEYVTFLCTHRPSLQPIERLSEAFGIPTLAFCLVGVKTAKLRRLEDVKVVTRLS